MAIGGRLGWLGILFPAFVSPCASVRSGVAPPLCLTTVLVSMPDSIVWGRLLCTGTQESEPYRRIELTRAEFVIGRNTGVHERYDDRQVSATHCKIILKRPEPRIFEDEDDDRVAQVWLEDFSSNGTFLNNQRLGKGNRAKMEQNDEIGFIRACGGVQSPPYSFIFQDFTADLELHELDSLLGTAGLPPSTVPATPRDDADAVDSGKRGSEVTGKASSHTSPQHLGVAVACDPENAELAESEAMLKSFQILAAPDPKGHAACHFSRQCQMSAARACLDTTCCGCALAG